MRPPATIIPLSLRVLTLATFLSPLATLCRAQMPAPNTSEMQDRASSVIQTRALPLMEEAARAAGMSQAQAAQVELLLKEQRRMMTLFLNFSGLSGDTLQAKLLEVLDTTRGQLEACRDPNLP